MMMMIIIIIIKGFSDVSWSQVLTRSDASITRGHNWKLQKMHNQSDIRLHFFSRRCINRWNSLNQDAVDAPSVTSFKHHLDKIRHQLMGFFMD